MGERGWWFVGVVTMLAAVGMLFADMKATYFMSVAALGLVICAIAQTVEVRRTGMTADAVSHFAETIVVGAIVVGFFFNDVGWVLLACVAVGIVALFVSFGAQIWEKVGETKALWRRYKRWQSEKK